MGTPVVLLKRSAAATKGAAGTALTATKGAAGTAFVAGTALAAAAVAALFLAVETRAATKGAAGTAEIAGTAAAAGTADVVTVGGKGLALEFDANLHSRVIAVFGADRIALGPFSASETVRTSSSEISDFTLADHSEDPLADALGSGRRYRLRGRASSASGAPGLEKTVEVSLYDDFPQAAVLQTTYANTGTAPVTIASWSQNHYSVAATNGAAGTAVAATNGAAGTAIAEPAFWSYQSGSYEARPDWVLPLKKGFRQDNFQGMNADDYGGGTPVADVWRRDAGLAVGHLELVPKLVSLPVTRPERDVATLAVRQAVGRVLGPGEKLTTLRTFVIAHRGDYFSSLVAYRRIMLRQGVTLPTAPPDAFQPIWCAWGYGRDFTTEQVLATIPVAQQLGFGWVTLDDGWQVAEGDWTPVRSKFPRGDADMKAFVDKIHTAGLKAQLWWSPLSANPGSRTEREHPDWLLRNSDGSTRKISWWDAFYLCPAVEAVRDDARAFVRKALGEWGFDGLKIDGQHLNGAPPCYNPSHGHASPEEASEGVPGFFRAIWEEAQATRPGAVVEICPCGTGYSFFTMPYLNMTVASDPESSWQVRLKGKTLKALHGSSIAYFGDHVEMERKGDDFASTLGVGGVVGSNFAWPGAPGKKDPKVLLTPEREKAWAFWVKLYQEKRLSEGEYLGELYDIGFDRPETHAIRKGGALGSLYYAIYADRFGGKVELRGLEARRYRVRDYESGRELGTVEGPRAPLEVAFKKHLLLEAVPQ